ncbi:hypothetical protein E4U55_005672, partial [Claviceps digitariae]
MHLKRKRSEPEPEPESELSPSPYATSSADSGSSSPPSIGNGGVEAMSWHFRSLGSVAAAPVDGSGRTRKRFRDGRPSEELVH